MLSPPHSRLTPGSVVAALLLSATTGAGLTALLFATTVLATPQSGGIITAIPALLLALVLAWPLWFGGLLLIGGPCWWLLHQSRVRSPWAGLATGVGLTFAIAGGYLVMSSYPPSARLSDAMSSWIFVAVLTVIGGAAGWVLIKVAYPQESVR